uniref:Endonuclease/exonuclease/phosphatase domain-containing protein n=1 Tax=Cacopsylla melanoneura TaxID=428564 RepID=A0A8D8THS9_9HEMI
MKGGGILIAIKKNIQSKPLIALNIHNETTETLWVQCKIYGQNLNLCACYFPPSVHPNTLKEFVDDTYGQYELLNDNIMFIGDFNIKEFLDPQQENSNRMIEMKKLTNFFNLEQYNDIKNKNSVILDLCLTNLCQYKISKNKTPEIKIERNPGLVPPVGHHPPLCITLNLYSNHENNTSNNKDNPSQRKLNYNKADYLKISNELEDVDWYSLLVDDKSPEKQTDEIIEIFYNEINKIINKHVPMTQLKKNTFPVWWTHNTKKLYKQKERLRKIKHKSNQQKNKYQHLRKQCKKRG